VKADDIPLAQDCCGDQFLLRSNKAFRLHGETGEVDDLALDWCEFFAAAAANPVEFLSLRTLESANGASLRPIAFSDSLRDTPESDKPPR
jgi:hypothetical protein